MVVFKRLTSLSVSLLFACLPLNSLAVVEVQLWSHAGQESEREALKEVIRRFGESNPEVRVKPIFLPEGSYAEQVYAAALSGDLPDLLDFDGPNIANYVWLGFLEPLENWISADLIKDILPSLIEQGTYPIDKKLYSLSAYDGGLGMWGNKTLLKKAGVRIPKGVDEAWTREEFEKILVKLSKTPGVRWPLDMKLNYGEGEWFTYGFSPFIQAMGGDLINRYTWRASGTLNNSGAIEALTMVQRWIKKGWVVPAAEGDTKFYKEQNVGISFVGFWMYDAHREAMGDDLVLLPMPKFGRRHATGSGSWNWGISADSEHKKEAGAFLEFMMQPESIMHISNATGAIPGRKSVVASSELYAPGGPLEIYYQQVGTITVPRLFHPAYPEITAAFARAVNNIISGKDVKKQLTNAAKNIDQDIDDNEGYPPFSK